MSLVIHLFKKDLRRSQLLLGFWVVLVAVQYAIMASSLHPGDRIAQLVFSVISNTGPSLRSLVLAVLVALLVQEEAPAGTTGFWLTRPMSRLAVLKTKLLFGSLLVALPVVAEIVVLAYGGVTPHDVALAVPEVVLSELQVMLVVAVLAALTPNFARFAIAGVVAWVGLYLISLVANWLPTYLQHDGEKLAKNAARLGQSRVIARDVLIAIGLAAAFVYQYLTRRTARVLAIVIVVELGAIAIDNLWTWNFFSQTPKPGAIARLDATSIRTTLSETSVQDRQDFRDPGQPKKNISGGLLIEGLPEGNVALPKQVRPRLTLADGRSIEAREPMQTNYIFEPNSTLFNSALGKVFVYGHAWDSLEIPSGLALIEADTFRKYAQQPLTYSAEVDFDVSRMVVTARMPLAKGSHVDLGSDHTFITGVLREGNRIEVLLDRRYANLLFARPKDENLPDKYLVSLGYPSGGKMYVLLNRRTREVVRTQMNGVLRLSLPRPNSRLVEEAWQLSFGPDNMELTPNLDEEWLAAAELIELELQPTAEFTQSLVVNHFVLEGPNKTKTRSVRPPSDPEWLTRFVLPEHATKIQMRKYVDNLVAAAPYWHADAWSELPVAMLSKVGPGNADVFVGALNQARPDFNEARLLVSAILRASGPEDKAPVLSALKDNPDLVDLVVKFKWQADCKDTLTTILRDEKRNNLPRNLIVAVASLDDRSTYTDLKAYLVRTRNRQATYNAIRELPDINLGETVVASWKQAKNGSHAEVIDAAPMAIDVGLPDALEILVNVLRENDLSQPQQIRRTLTLVRRYTPVRGDASSVVTWFDSNKDRLVFSAEQKKFLPVPPQPKM